MADALDLVGRVRRYDFFALMRRFECARRDLPRWGRALRPADEALRLEQEPNLGFAASPLATFTPASDERPARLAVNVLGLTGPQGPLPLAFSEYVYQRARHHDDPTWHDFLGLFQHRMLSLYYRAWADAQPVVAADRPDDDLFARSLAALSGQVLDPTATGAVPQTAHLHFAALLAGTRRSAAALERLLAGYFRLPVAVCPFAGEYLALGRHDQTRLGRTPLPLGRGLALGQRSWSAAHRFRVVFGPLDARAFTRLQPDGAAAAALHHWLQTFAGERLDWQLELRLAPDAWQPSALGNGSRIGRNCWLGRPKAPCVNFGASAYRQGT